MKYEEKIKINKKIKNVRHIKLKNGFGSISYLGNNRTNPFMIRASATYSLNDKGNINYTDNSNMSSKRKVIGYCDDYYKALEILIEYNKNPNFIEKATLTFGDIFEMWKNYEIRRNENLPSEKKKKKPFADNYISVYNNQCQSLYNKKILEISTSDIQSCVDNCEKSFSTVKYIKLLCKKIFKHAKFLGAQVDLDTVNFVEVGTPEESDLHINFTQEEKDILWKNIYNKEIDPLGIIDTILIMIYSGMRPTELLELKTRNVHINEKYMIGGIKTSNGIDREIPIHEKIIPLIKKRYNENNEYLIMKAQNEAFNYRHYLDVFKDVTSRLGIKHLPHDCRDTTATEMYNNEVKPLIYKLILGHSIEDITEKHYVNITLEQKLEAINTIK